MWKALRCVFGFVVRLRLDITMMTTG